MMVFKTSGQCRFAVYFCGGTKKKGKGRNRKHEGKINFENLDLKRAKLVSELESIKLLNY